MHLSYLRVLTIDHKHTYCVRFEQKESTCVASLVRRVPEGRHCDDVSLVQLLHEVDLGSFVQERRQRGGVVHDSAGPVGHDVARATFPLEKACKAGGILLFEANTIQTFVINCQNSLLTQMHERADLVEIIAGFHKE